MSKRGLFIALAIALTICAVLAGIIGTSGASFTSARTPKVSASTGGAPSLLHLYSASTDPAGAKTFYKGTGVGGYSATGSDYTLAVNLGTVRVNRTTSCNQVFLLQAPSPFPTGITSVTVNVVLSGDTRGWVTSYGIATWGSTSRGNNLSLSAGGKLQFNLVAAPPAGTSSGITENLTLQVTTTYSGFSGTFFRYTVTPFTVTSN